MRAGNNLRRHIGLIGNFDGDIDRNRAGLRIKQQRKAHHTHQHQHGRANESVPGTTTHGFHAFALGQPAGSLGASHRLGFVFFAGPTEIEKCHGIRALLESAAPPLRQSGRPLVQ